MANRHDDAAVIVTNGTPFRNGAVASVAPAAPEVTCPGNLNSIVQIIEDVKYFILISQLFDRPPGKDHFHAAHKGFPFVIAVGIVGKHETASKQVLAQAGGLRLDRKSTRLNSSHL